MRNIETRQVGEGEGGSGGGKDQDCGERLAFESCPMK
jgi:hypothetical protein